MENFKEKFIKGKTQNGIEVSQSVRLFLGDFGWTIQISDMGITCPIRKFFESKEKAEKFFQKL